MNHLINYYEKLGQTHQNKTGHGGTETRSYVANLLANQPHNHSLCQLPFVFKKFVPVLEKKLCDFASLWQNLWFDAFTLMKNRILLDFRAVS